MLCVPGTCCSGSTKVFFLMSSRFRWNSDTLLVRYGPRVPVLFSVAAINASESEASMILSTGNLTAFTTVSMSRERTTAAWASALGGVVPA